MEAFPNEILGQIFFHLSPEDLTRTERVCKKFADVARGCIYEREEVIAARRVKCK